MNGKCLIPICSLCVDDHKRGCRAVGNPKLLCRLTTYLCQEHFDGEVEKIHNNNIMLTVEYEREVPFYNELEKLPTKTIASVKEQRVSEDIITYSESDDWKELPKYDLMLNENVGYATIFEKRFARDDDDNSVMMTQNTQVFVGRFFTYRYWQLNKYY